MDDIKITKHDIQVLWEDIESLMMYSNHSQKVWLYFIRSHENNIFKYEINVEDKVTDSLLELIHNFYVSDAFRNREVCRYDPIFHIREAHCYCPRESYFKKIHDRALEWFDSDNVIRDLDDNQLEQYSDYMIRWITEHDEREYLVFGSLSLMSSISKASLVGRISSDSNQISRNCMRELNLDNAFGLSGNLDTVLWRDIKHVNKPTDCKILIHGVRGFERIFPIKEIFEQEATKTLESTNLQKYLDQDVLKELSTKSQGGGRIARRLTKLKSDERRFDAFFSNIDKTKKILADPNHPNKDRFKGVLFNEETGKLSINLEEGKIENLINLISDGSYIAEVSGVKDFDEGR